MKKSPELRKARRLKQNGTVMLADKFLGYYTYAQVGNVSGEGMYFESEHALEPGKEIVIQYNNPPFKSAPKTYSATVQWCKYLSEKESSASYGVGIKYI